MVAHSTIRNCFGEQWKEKYQDLRCSSKQAEGQSIAASVDLIAVNWEVTGGGAVGVVRTSAINIRRPTVTMFRGHKGPVQDIEFSPFYDSIFATASEDTSIKIWEVCPEGAVTVKQDSIATLAGHDKKALMCSFNPTADWIIASGSADATVKVWDVEEEKNAFSGRHPEAVTGLAWNSNGSVIATTCKDKKLRVLDPRQKSTVVEVVSHEGTKPSKVVWLSGMDIQETCLVTAGFSKGASRECFLWDTRNAAAPIANHVFDRQSGTIIPHWEEGSGLLFFPGKGDGNIRIAQIVNSSSFSFLTEFRSSNPSKACNFIPSRGVDVMKCELARAVRIEGNSVVQPVSFVVPRKSTEFQQDLFPDCRAGEPSTSAAKWLKGATEEPVRKSMQPGADGSSPFKSHIAAYKNLANPAGDENANPVEAPKETSINNSGAVLRKELSRAGSKIAVLSQEVSSRETTTKSLTSKNDELEAKLSQKDKEMQSLKTELGDLRRKVALYEELYTHCHSALHTAAWKASPKK